MINPKKLIPQREETLVQDEMKHQSNIIYRVFGNERYTSVCLLHRVEMSSQNLNRCQKFAIYRTF